jgi:hypothetical protein
MSRFQPPRDEVGEAEPAVLCQNSGELLLGIIGGAFAGGVFAAQPTAAALTRATERLADAFAGPTAFNCGFRVKTSGIPE